MKFQSIAIVLGFVLAIASPAAAQEECRRLTISDTPPLDRIEIEPLTQDDDKGVKWSGAAMLFLDDGTPVPLLAKRKLRKKTGNWKYKLKTPKKVKPKVKVSAELGGDPETVLKLKIKFKGDVKVKLKDPALVAVGPCSDPGNGGSSFLVGPAGGTFDVPDVDVSLMFPPGAVPEDTTITVTQIDPPAGTDFIAGTMYEFSPDIDFTQPVDLTIAYDEAAITGAEADLRLALLLTGDPAEGTEHECPLGSVDEVNNTVTGYVTSFSSYGLLGGMLFPPSPLRAVVNPNASVTLTWSETNAPSVILQRAKIRSGLPCLWVGTPHCIDTGSGTVTNGLQQPTNPDFTWSMLLESDPTEYTDIDPASAPGVYYYRICALDDGRQSAWTPPLRVLAEEDTSPPAAPSTLVASTYLCGGVALFWAHVPGANYYQIERKLTADPDTEFRAIGYETSGVCHHIDTTRLTPSTQHDYRVLAVNDYGTGPGARVTVTSLDPAYTVSLSDYRPTISGDDSANIDVMIDRISGPGDVTLGASVNSSRVSATFEPATTDGDSLLVLELVKDAPIGLQVLVEITAEIAGGGGPCTLPVLLLTVVERPPWTEPEELTLVSLDPSTVPADTPYTVTLHGTGFVEGSTVYLDYEPMFDSTVVNSKVIIANLPALDPGTHQIRVATPDERETPDLEISAEM